MQYDVIVIGGGHAGIEATLAPARMGLKVCLVTLDKNFIGHMPCNPSIGGPAKGIVVREIDALGGQMSKTIDKTYLQMKMLNSSKGPGVWSLRAQADKMAYPRMMQDVISNHPNVSVIESAVEGLIINGNKVEGITLEDGTKVLSKTVVITTGTYLDSRILIGSTATHSGPDDQRTTFGLSKQLKDLGFELQKLKTGTPPRILNTSIDYSKAEKQPGMGGNLGFSFLTKEFKTVEQQDICWLIYTNLDTHKIILENLTKSAMYGGIEGIASTGPRYCPSIDDKVYKFSDKDRHQLFLEPESPELNTIYLQGFSSSMPLDVQDKMIRTLPGLENCEVIKYAYAIEYDAIVPTQLYPTLETKLIDGLFSAGQINGTSGYEEAAGQGLIAGINAGNKVLGKEPLVLRRDEAYIGVMIDDLVTKGTQEPYRLLTSRAEHRLLLRHDNADLRLREYGIKYNLLSDDEIKHFEDKLVKTNELLNILEQTRYTPKSKINDCLNVKLTSGISALELLKRPEVNLQMILDDLQLDFNWQIVEQLEVQVKFEGYISKAKEQAKKMLKLEEKNIPEDIDYDSVNNLALEAKQKLKKIKPMTIGQASRISGINPADIDMILFYLKNNGKEN